MSRKEKTIDELVAAAKGGDRAAMRELGDRYYDGVGVRRDRTKSAEWYKKALESIGAAGGPSKYININFKKSAPDLFRIFINNLSYMVVAFALTAAMLWVIAKIGFFLAIIIALFGMAGYYMMADTKGGRLKR